MNLEQKVEKPHNLIPYKHQSQLRVLVVTAVSAERDAVLHGLNTDPRFDVLVGGVGSVVAAVNTTKALAKTKYGLVICAGIGGGFSGRAEVGSLVVGTEIVAADLGAETPEGFNSVDELGFGFSRIQTDANLVERVTKALEVAKLSVNIGSVLTVSTVTGTAETAAELVERIKGASAEAMEGFGVAFAAFDRGVPVLEIRAISNMVGPRERSAWRIKEALDVLQAACEVLTGVVP